MWRAFCKTSDQEAELYLLIDNKLATYRELQQDYSLPDMLDLLEMLEVRQEMQWAAEKDKDVAMKAAEANNSRR